MWPRFGPALVYFIYLFSWLTCSLPMACLWPKLQICKQEWTTQMPSFAKCWIWDSDLGQFCLIWFIHGWHWAFLWLAWGPNLAKSRGLPKCHHSMRYMGQMNVSGVGLIWDSGILLSGYAFTVCKRVNLLEKKTSNCLCSTKESQSYKFGTTWWWANYEQIMIYFSFLGELVIYCLTWCCKFLISQSLVRRK